MLWLLMRYVHDCLLTMLMLVMLRLVLTMWFNHGCWIIKPQWCWCQFMCLCSVVMIWHHLCNQEARIEILLRRKFYGKTCYMIWNFIKDKWILILCIFGCFLKDYEIVPDKHAMVLSYISFHFLTGKACYILQVLRAFWFGFVFIVFYAMFFLFCIVLFLLDFFFV